MTAAAVRQLVVGGVRTPVTEAGPEGAAEAVVPVHGNPGSARDFDWLIDGVAAFARVVAPDMPGYGRSERPRDLPYTVQGYADHLQGVLEATGVERAHLVLHDFGGPWGLRWAAQHPGAFASVTLINTGVLVDYGWHYMARIWRTPGFGAAFQAATTKAALKLVLNHDNPVRLPDAFIDRLWADASDPGHRRAVRRLYRATETSELAALGDPLATLGRPALVVWGTGDRYLPVALAEKQRRTFPDAEVVLLDGAGHWPFADRPDAVREPVLRFLRTQAGAA